MNLKPQTRRIAVCVMDLAELAERDLAFRSLTGQFAQLDAYQVAEPGLPDEDALILNGPAAADALRLAAFTRMLLRQTTGGHQVRVWEEGPRGGWNPLHQVSSSQEGEEEYDD